MEKITDMSLAGPAGSPDHRPASVTGPVLPDAAAALVAAAEHVARSSLGFDGLYPFQKEVLGQLFSGRDVVAVLPTGSGKTLCYALPAMVRPGLVLVISPLIALIRDQIRRFEEFDIPCAFFDSMQSAGERDDTWERLRSGKVRILVISPERLARVDFRERLHDVPIQLCAVDEAHCISQWGNHFRPDYRFIGDYLREFGPLQKLAVTATATAKVRNDIATTLGMNDPGTVVSGIMRENLTLRIVKASKVVDQLNTMLQAVLSSEGQGIVYAPTRTACRDLFRVLSDGRVKCGMYHAGLTAPQREYAQNNFISGELRVMVATHAFGMGIDKSDIRFVHHFGLPASVESYVQEIGRAGRDGLPAKCWMVYGSRDHHIRKFMMDKTFPDADRIRAVLAAVRVLTDNHHGASETAVARQVASQLDCDHEVVTACLEILFREGLLVRLTSGGFGYGGSGAIIADGNPSLDESFFRDYPLRIFEAESRLAAIRSFAGLPGEHASFLENYFRTPGDRT
jgi:ATP-dependent DNA helicase RecQ